MQDSCEDTLVTETVAYHTIPNVPLKAGELDTLDTVIAPGIYENIPPSSITVYQNPLNEYFKVGNSSAHRISFSLINITGQRIRQNIVIEPNSIQTIYTTELPGGLYILKSEGPGGRIAKKVFVQ